MLRPKEGRGIGSVSGKALASGRLKCVLLWAVRVEQTGLTARRPRRVFLVGRLEFRSERDLNSKWKTGAVD